MNDARHRFIVTSKSDVWLLLFLNFRISIRNESNRRTSTLYKIIHHPSFNYIYLLPFRCYRDLINWIYISRIGFARYFFIYSVFSFLLYAHSQTLIQLENVSNIRGIIFIFRDWEKKKRKEIQLMRWNATL